MKSMESKEKYQMAKISPLRNVTQWIVDNIVVIVLAIFLTQGLGDRVVMEGNSMESTLSTGDVVLVDRILYHFTKIERFDIVLFHTEDGQKTSVKRVVGLPGEKIQIIDGNIYIDGEYLDVGEVMSGYTVAGLASDVVMLKEGEYFLLGDNGDSSEDSRFSAVGKVKKEQIEGCVWLRISPFAHFGFLSGVT